MANLYPIRLNNVSSTVQAGSSAIGSSAATGVNVAGGDGANFGTIGTDQFIPAVIVDTSTSPETVKEYVWVTSRSTDALTVVRQAEESSRYAASTTTIQAGYTIAAVATNAGLAIGRLVGLTQYAPARTVYSTTSTSLVAVDSTNLTVQFVAPPSGRVLVRQTCFASTGGGPGFWALFTHGTTTQVGLSIEPNLTAGIMISVVQLITGLTAGTAYQWDWAWGLNAGTSMALVVYGGTGTTASFTSQGAPAVMEVWAA